MDSVNEIKNFITWCKEQKISEVQVSTDKFALNVKLAVVAQYGLDKLRQQPDDAPNDDNSILKQLSQFEGP